MAEFFAEGLGQVWEKCFKHTAVGFMQPSTTSYVASHCCIKYIFEIFK